VGASAPSQLGNPGSFTLGEMPSPNLPAFVPDPNTLSKAGSASTPFGFGGPNPFAALTANPGTGTGAQAGPSNTQLGDNAQMMQALMAKTPTQPAVPPAVPIQPINIPPIQYT
jgi:hypothetical protein